jgi:long-chain acyl-CoA synthetase
MSAADAAYMNGGPRPQPGTLTQLFFEAIERFDRPDALQYKKDGRYIAISHQELLARVRHAAAGLSQLGLKRGDRIALLSENRPEWAIADLASLCVGFTDVAIYPNLPADQIAYLLKDSGAVAIFVSTAAQAAKIAAIRGEVPSLKNVIAFDEGVSAADVSFADLTGKGAAGETAESVARFRSDALSAKPDDLATLIYTSGTTGEPKGVMLTHDNLYSNVAACKEKIPFGGVDTCLSFLPLSHIFARMGDHYMMIATGTSIAYAESMDTIPENLMEVHPTIVLSVPRLYEKMYARILDTARTGGAVKKRIFFWALAVADAWATRKLDGKSAGAVLSFKYVIAQRLVFSKLKDRTGGRLRYFVSGGAPLAPEINKFFFAAGIMILEGYGLTETSPVISVNTPEEFRIGTIGKPIGGVEVRIAPDTGEICVRSPGVMRGYYNKPEDTANAIDAEGWFHTGDIGEIRDGFLAITDRLKDIIVTAGGKNIAPQPIENLLKSNKYVSVPVMIGDKRKFPVMLIIPNFDNLERWAGRQGITYANRGELIRKPEVVAKMQQEMERTLSGLASFERPKKVALIEHEFTVERGELSAKASVKRHAIDKAYKELIDSLYAEG